MSPKSECGLSLISLMVGLTISMLVILATLSTYKATVGITVGAGQDARLNGQLTSGVLAAQINLQSAGFGIEAPAYGTNLVVLTGAAFGNGNTLGSGSTAAEGNAVVWDWDTDPPGGPRKCGLLIHPLGGGLQYATAANCSQAGDWNTITWSTPVVLVENAPDVSITTQSGACSPFGTGSSIGNLSVRIKTTNSNAVTAFHSVCLGNFEEPSP